MIESPLLTSMEASEYLRVHSRTLAEWRTDGSGPPYLRVGRRAFYRQADLDAWLNSRVVGSVQADEVFIFDGPAPQIGGNNWQCGHCERWQSRKWADRVWCEQCGEAGGPAANHVDRTRSSSKVDTSRHEG